MSILAHLGDGAVNTWGFAYAGGIVGLISSALYYVHRTVALRSTNAPTPSFPLRWIVPIGFVAGISIGLGVGRLLDSAFDGGSAGNPETTRSEVVLETSADTDGWMRDPRDPRTGE